MSKLMWVLKVAWRNLWRHTRRTLITAAALALSVLAMTFSHALVEGLSAQTVRTATDSRLGHAQIHAAEYPQRRNPQHMLQDVEPLRASALTHPGILAASARHISPALLTHASSSSSVQLLGVTPAHERSVTQWHERVVRGEWFADGEAQPDAREVVLGRALAERLQVAPGDEVQLAAASLKTGEVSHHVLKVRGVMSTGDNLLDERAALVRLSLAQQITASAGQAHEIALRVDAPVADQQAIDVLLKPLEAPGRTVRAWHAINPMVAQVLALQERWMGVAVFLFFVLVSFAIINTVSMSFIERIKEFGVMRALGTSPLQLAAAVLVEAASLGAVGAIPGALLGVGIIASLQTGGLRFDQGSQYGMTFTEPLIPPLDPWGALQIALTFIALTTLTASLTAWRATRIAPVEAMRSGTAM